MSKLAKHYIVTSKALANLQRALETNAAVQELDDKKFVLAARDSTVLCFRLCVEQVFRYLSQLLKDLPAWDRQGPERIIQSCATMRLFTKSDTLAAYREVECHDMVSLGYKNEIAAQIVSAAPAHYRFLSHILKKAKPEKL